MFRCTVTTDKDDNGILKVYINIQVGNPVSLSACIPGPGLQVLWSC